MWALPLFLKRYTDKIGRAWTPGSARPGRSYTERRCTLEVWAGLFFLFSSNSDTCPDPQKKLTRAHPITIFFFLDRSHIWQYFKKYVTYISILTSARKPSISLVWKNFNTVLPIVINRLFSPMDFISGRRCLRAWPYCIHAPVNRSRTIPRLIFKRNGSFLLFSLAIFQQSWKSY